MPRQTILALPKPPRYFVAHLREQGDVDVVLPDFTFARKAVHLVRAPELVACRRARLFMDRFIAELAQTPGFHLAPDLRPMKVPTATTT